MHDKLIKGLIYTKRNDFFTVYSQKKKKKETQGTWYTSNPFIRKITSRKQNTALHR